MKKSELVVGETYACYAPQKMPGDSMTVTEVVLLGTEMMSVDHVGWRLPEGQYYSALTTHKQYAKKSGLPVAVRASGVQQGWRPSVMAVNQFRMPYAEFTVQDEIARANRSAAYQKAQAEGERKRVIADYAEGKLREALGDYVPVTPPGRRNSRYSVELSEEQLGTLVSIALKESAEIEELKQDVAEQRAFREGALA